MNVFLARWLSPVEYGAYAVSWSVLLVVAGIHNALILEPMTVIGPAAYTGRMSSYLREVRRLNWMVVGLLGLLCFPIGLAYRQAAVRPALYVLGFSLPGYLLFLVARRRQYVMNVPLRALGLSLIYALLVFIWIAMFRIRGTLSAGTAVAALGLAWFTSIEFGEAGKTGLVEPGILVREHWRYGKWLLASAVLAIGISDMQTILLSMLADLKSAGALRALMNFVLPLTQLMTVLSVYALPRLSERAAAQGTDHFLRRAFFFPIAMVTLAAVYLIAMTLLAPQLERVLYAGKLRAYVGLMPLLAVSALASAVGAALSTLLRAVQNSQHQFIAGITGSMVGVGCALLWVRSQGVSGAMWSMIAANSASALVIAFIYWRQARRCDASA